MSGHLEADRRIDPLSDQQRPDSKLTASAMDRESYQATKRQQFWGRICGQLKKTGFWVRMRPCSSQHEEGHHDMNMASAAPPEEAGLLRKGEWGQEQKPRGRKCDWLVCRGGPSLGR